MATRHRVAITRENWATLADEAGVSIELIAALTGVSYTTAFRYRDGSRQPSDTWIARAGEVIRERAITEVAELRGRIERLEAIA